MNVKLSELICYLVYVCLSSDPSHVIGLYPGLLPEDFRNKLEYPERVPEIQGVEHEKGLMALIEYLTQVHQHGRYILGIVVSDSVRSTNMVVISSDCC